MLQVGKGAFQTINKHQKYHRPQGSEKKNPQGCPFLRQLFGKMRGFKQPSGSQCHNLKAFLVGG